MRKNVFNEKSINFRNDVKAAKVEVKNAGNNVFLAQKVLRQLAKKNDFCDGQSVAKVAKAVRNYTKGGSLFDLSAFKKDAFGNYIIDCKRTTINGITGEKETYITTRFVGGNFKSLFNDFCAIAAKELKAIEKAEKDAFCEEQKAENERKKEIEKAKKIKVRKINDLQKALDKGIITESEYNNKVLAIKAA